MRKQRVEFSKVLALVALATLAPACGLKRDWSVCAPTDKQPCLPGYVCTADLSCVRAGDGGSDGPLSVDSRGPSDAAGRGERDWSICSPPAEMCQSGFACTSDFRCVPVGGGSSDGPLAVDGVLDTGGGTAPANTDGPTTPALDGPEPDRAPGVVPPDAPAGTAPDAPPVASLPDAPPASLRDAPPVSLPDTAPASVPDAPPASPPDGPPVSPPDARIPDAPIVDAAGSCSTDKDCSPQKPLCLGNQCAKCSGDSDCTGRTGTPACAASGLCVACTANSYCTGVAGTCDTATNQCVGCVTRSDCAGQCQTCTNGVCKAVKSQDDPGVCAGTCDSTGACKSRQGQTCQTAGGGCAAGTTCSPDGVCCDSTCNQACRSCLGSKTGGADGTCANVTNGTSCGASGHYCSAGTCGSACLISGTVYTSGAASSTNPCQTCQPAVSATSWSPLGNGTGCGSGQICSAGTCQTGCWIGGSFVGTGATNASNICQICNPTKSATGWSNNDAHANAPCGTCGGTESCSNTVLSACSKTTGTFYQDYDGDGYGNPNVTPVVTCTAPTGWVSQCCDCDDTDMTNHPGTTECDNFNANTLWSCLSSGSVVSTTCSNGCAGGQCRTFPFPTMDVAGTVTCGNLQCPTSQGCSFGGGWTGQPVCGSPVKYYHATCDGQNDCPSGQVCCWTSSGGSAGEVGCFPAGTCPHFQMGSNAYLICDPNQADSCPAGSTCTILSPYSTYYCQPN